MYQPAYELRHFVKPQGFDRILRNAVLPWNNSTTTLRVDIGINIETRKNSLNGLPEPIATIVDIGDLRTFTALEDDIDAHGAELDPARIRLDHPFPAGEVPLLIKRR